MQIVTTLAELDAKIEECNRAEAISDDRMRQVFGTFSMAPPAGLSGDPFSDAYRQAQLALYRDVAGREYSTANEVTAFDIEAAVRRPFPYYTGSGTTAGEQLMAIGFILRAMALPPGSRILEFGPGWGNTTIALAQLGHHVTAVDIEPHFCELLRRRAERAGVAVTVVEDDFLWAERCTERFDAVLFYECFHHCADHLRLLRALDGVVAPQGRLFFAGEPITRDFPMPWGLRLDGNSLWAIRKCGWLELGFHEDYFQAALLSTGWRGVKHGCADPGWQSVWEATRIDRVPMRLAGTDPRLATATGRRSGSGIILEAAAAGTALYGPYVALPPGRYAATLHFRGMPLSRGTARMDVACRGGQLVLGDRPIEGSAIGPGATGFAVAFELAEAASDLEVRLFNDAGFSAVVEAVEITAS